MIVVDTNVIASLVLPTSKHTGAATALLRCDREWAAPSLWRSELCNVLTTGVRNGWFGIAQALEALSAAEDLMEGGEFAVTPAEVVKTAVESGCSGYDAEFVVLARDLSVQLVTLDGGILKAFPGIAVSLEDVASGGAA